MGCDIHMLVETREPDGTWHNRDRWKNEGGEIYPVYVESIYNNRNYDLFAILADVRNGYGFAGCTTGDGFVPIAAPRGVPEDASEEFQKYSNQWGIDGHSHSYFTVAELMAYDWTQTTRKAGVVDLKEYVRFKQRGAPESYCGGISRNGIVQLTVETVDRAWEKLSEPEQWTAYRGDLSKLSALLGPPEQHTYTQVWWEIPYYRAAEEFLSETLPRLWRLGKPEDVRILFFFDN